MMSLKDFFERALTAAICRTGNTGSGADPNCAAAPLEGALLIGHVLDAAGGATPLWLGPEWFQRPIWELGGSGSGKTTLMLLIYVYLLSHARTLLCDFRVDLAYRSLLALIQEGGLASAGQTYVFDFSRPELLPPLNPLSSRCGVTDPLTRGANMLAGMQAADTSGPWGTTIVECGRNVLSLVAYNDGSLMDAHRVLSDPAARVAAMDGCPDDFVLGWFRSFHNSSESRQREASAPFLNRCSHYLARPEIREWLGSERSVSVADVLDGDGDARIVVAAAADIVSPPVARMVLNVVMGIVCDVILARARIPEADRKPVHILVDEAQNVCSLPQVPVLLSEGRRYKGVCLLANQYQSQFAPEPRQAASGNAAMQALFQCDGAQASMLAPNVTSELSLTEVRSLLVSLPQGECLLVRRGMETTRLRVRHYKDPAGIGPALVEQFRQAAFAKFRGGRAAATAQPAPAADGSRPAAQAGATKPEEVLHVRRPDVP